MTKSALNRAAELFGRRDDEPDDDDDTPGIFAMSIRLPSPVACQISVMAGLVNVSRNEMANIIIEAGLDAVMANLPDEAAADIHQGIASEIDSFI